MVHNIRTKKRLNAGCKSPRHQCVSTSYVQSTEKIGASGYDCHTDDSGVWSTARTRWCCDVWRPNGRKTYGFCKYDLALWHEDVFIFNFMIFHKWFMILGFDSYLYWVTFLIDCTEKNLCEISVIQLTQKPNPGFSTMSAFRSTTWDVAPYHPSTIAAVTSLIGIMPGPLQSDDSVRNLSGMTSKAYRGKNGCLQQTGMTDNKILFVETTFLEIGLNNVFWEIHLGVPFVFRQIGKDIVAQINALAWAEHFRNGRLARTQFWFPNTPTVTKWVVRKYSSFFCFILTIEDATIIFKQGL